MIKVLIVDDEPIMRTGLLHFVNWEVLNCAVVSEASNGLEAKEFLEKNEVDIIIADIRMPGMDGIQLAKWIYENKPDTKVILLTAYADFSYAQSAVKYSVVEFVTKTNPAEEIPAAVIKAQQLISLRKEKEEQLKILEERVDAERSSVQEKFIKDVINGIVIDARVIDAGFSDFGFPQGGYFVIAYRIDHLLEEMDGASPEELNTFLFSVRDFLNHALKNYCHSTTIMDMRSLCSIVAMDPDQPPLVHTQTLLITCNEILAMVDNFRKFSLSIGISAMHRSLPELPKGHAEAVEALSELFYSDNNVSVYDPRPEVRPGQEILLLRGQVDEIVSKIQEGDTEQATKVLETLFDEYRKYKVSIDQVKVTGMLLCSLCFRLIPNYLLDLPESRLSEPDIYKQIRNHRSLSGIQAILRGVIDSIARLISSSKKQNNYLVIQVNRFIRENYNKEISLKIIANHIHVNSSYLSRLYRKSTGESVIEALNKHRIDVAKELLSSSSMRVFEVAYAVGIDDPTYFTHVFVKYVGMSPKEFKTRQIAG
jgi:two-component system, response regulator YesN